MCWLNGYIRTRENLHPLGAKIYIRLSPCPLSLLRKLLRKNKMWEWYFLGRLWLLPTQFWEETTICPGWLRHPSAWPREWTSKKMVKPFPQWWRWSNEEAGMMRERWPMVLPSVEGAFRQIIKKKGKHWATPEITPSSCSSLTWFLQHFFFIA